MPFPLTKEQRAVVEDRGGGLLVSAAAGSGKTRVLVERLLARVESEGLDIDRFLVITYTKAAAAELRGRIVEELNQRLAQNPGDRHLRRQTTLVYKTQISTIHALCGQLLREYGHALELDPDFRLCDEGEAQVLMLSAMDEVLEERYEHITPESDFAHLVDTMAAGRDDGRLVQIALDIYGKVQSHPDPHAWLARQSQAFALEGVIDAADTKWGKLLLESARAQGEYWKGQMEKALDLISGEEKLSGAYGPSYQETADALGAFTAAAANGTWDRASAAVRVPFPRLGGVRGCQDPLLQEQVKTIREKCKKRMGKVADLLTDSSAQLLADMRAVYPAVGGLFALVEDFEARYRQEKERRGLLDFSDLEHFAVRLLGQADLAQTIAGRFDEVMVDEYQDTNEVQNAIFDALSFGGRDLFMVGDVKQSIYRFRLADPTIFLGKYRAFRDYTQAEDGEPRRILLSKNFRSRHQVLEGANFIFRNVMSRTFGEMDYTEDEALYAGAKYEGDATLYQVELDALDLSGEDEGEEKSPKDLMEARFIAGRIRELLDGGFPIGEGRPVRAGDIVILLRSPNTVLANYARALGERGLQWEADGGEDYFASTEVSVALSFLQILDNPRQDVPLLSVLRTPVFGFTADRLAQLRADAPDTDFYGALERGGQDCQDFVSFLTDLRDLAGDMSCHQLLWEIYDRANLLAIFGAMGDGKTRRGNLLALCECARQFEESGHKGLFGFLTHLSRIRERGGRLSAAPVAREGGGVRIMSIHKSKGLEFPVVFLAGLMRRLNREDMQKPMLFHPQLGVGPKGLDTQRLVEYPTLARRAVASQQELEMMAEELRLLYVAMTRAREKLILTCTLTGGGRDLQKLAGDAACPVEPQVLMGTQTVGQWVLLSVLARPDAEALRRGGEVLVELTMEHCGPDWDIRWVDGARLRQAAEPDHGPDIALSPEEQADLALGQALGWAYPHRGDVEIPSKLTATQLKGRQVDEEVAEAAPRAPQPIGFARPTFATEQLGLTAAEAGTALHLVMQFIDFDRAGTAAAAAGEIQRLVDKAIITPQQGQAAGPEKIAAFFQSSLGREMAASGTLKREFKFSILVPAEDYYDQAGAGETVLLQGVVDCWFETGDGLTVVDFKTDRVTAQTMGDRALDYRPQLDAYSRALEEVTGKTVARRVLWFFSVDAPVEI